MIERLVAGFERVRPDVEHASLRWHRERSEAIAVRSDVLEPWAVSDAAGVLVHSALQSKAATSSNR